MDIIDITNSKEIHPIKDATVEVSYLSFDDNGQGVFQKITSCVTVLDYPCYFDLVSPQTDGAGLINIFIKISGNATGGKYIRWPVGQPYRITLGFISGKYFNPGTESRPYETDSQQEPISAPKMKIANETKSPNWLLMIEGVIFIFSMVVTVVLLGTNRD
ncbi:MAG: hypothetical protein AB9888_13120 [Bacteroidales bacterium]